jgi:hypothetical protein
MCWSSVFGSCIKQMLSPSVYTQSKHKFKKCTQIPYLSGKPLVLIAKSIRGQRTLPTMKQWRMGWLFFLIEHKIRFYSGTCWTSIHITWLSVGNQFPWGCTVGTGTGTGGVGSLVSWPCCNMRSLLLVSGSNSDSGTSPSSLAGEPCIGSEKSGWATGWLNVGGISGESRGWAGWATAHPKIQPKLPNVFSISCHLHCNFAICLFVNAKQQESKSDLVFHVAICYHADS